MTRSQAALAAGMKRRLARLALGIVSLAIAYLALLVFPDPLFAHTRAGRFVVVHADAPIPASVDAIVRDTEARLARSPLWVPGVTHHLYVCQSAWRWRLLSNAAFHSGAYAMGPFARPVFTRPVHFDRDRLVGPSGHEAGGERTAAYFFAHEVTHTLSADLLGPVAYAQLPSWAREGYADYVARAEGFDYEANRALWRAGDPALDPQRSGLYLLYTLLVAHLLDREGWSPEQLLREVPDASALEARVREGIVLPR